MAGLVNEALGHILFGSLASNSRGRSTGGCTAGSPRTTTARIIPCVGHGGVPPDNHVPFVSRDFVFQKDRQR